MSEEMNTTSPGYRALSPLEQTVMGAISLMFVCVVGWAGIQLTETSAGLARMDERMNGLSYNVGRITHLMEKQVENTQLIKLNSERLNHHDRRFDRLERPARQE